MKRLLLISLIAIARATEGAEPSCGHQLTRNPATQSPTVVAEWHEDNWAGHRHFFREYSNGHVIHHWGLDRWEPYPCSLRPRNTTTANGPLVKVQEWYVDHDWSGRRTYYRRWSDGTVESKTGFGDWILR